MHGWEGRINAPIIPYPKHHHQNRSQIIFYLSKGDTFLKNICQEIPVSSERETPTEFRAKLTFQGLSKNEKLAEVTSKSGLGQSERKKNRKQCVYRSQGKNFSKKVVKKY